MSESTGVHLSYCNTLIHRIVPGGWIQGGDIIDGTGSGGESIYGKKFDGKYNSYRSLSCPEDEVSSWYIICDSL